MKPIDDLDHYEVLEVPPGAGYEDIERAYQMTRAAYTNGSLALYSIFTSDDASVIRNRIDEAYRVLADPKTREQYDVETGVSGEQPRSRSKDSTGEPVDAPARVATASEGHERAGAAAPELSSAIEVIEDIDADIDEESREFDGAALRAKGRRARSDFGRDQGPGQVLEVHRGGGVRQASRLGLYPRFRPCLRASDWPRCTTCRVRLHGAGRGRAQRTQASLAVRHSLDSRSGIGI